MNWSIFLCGAGLLCLAAWIDNLRGPILPAVVGLMKMDYRTASLIISLGNLMAMASTWLLMPLLNRRSLRYAGILVLIYTSIVCAGTFLVSSTQRILFWGSLIGSCLSTLGSLANLYVQAASEHNRRGQMMAALHSIYGFISFFAPWVAGLVLYNPSRWPYLFVVATPMSIALALVIQFRIKGPIEKQQNRSERQPITLRPLHILAVMTLVMYVAAEALTSTWLSTYLVQEKDFSIKEASLYTSSFFGLMFVTRVMCGLWVTPKWHRIIIWTSLVSAFLSFVFGMAFDWPLLLPGAGLLGPVFPLFISWLGLRFPERDRTLILWTLSGMQGALATMNYMMGNLGDYLGFSVAFWLPAVIMMITMILLKIVELKDSNAAQTL
jgi:fucose permease